jgi:hypothetical protein
MFEPFDRETITTSAGTFRVNYFYDDDAESPRHWSNVGRMVLSHRRYDLPSEDEDAARALEHHSPHVVARWLRIFRGASVVLPVWGYDHGAISFRAGDRLGQYADRWDSGLAGLIFDTPETREETGCPPELIDEALRGEVSTFSDWSNGMFVGFVIERLDDPDGEADPDDDGATWTETEDGALWGIEDQPYARTEARELIESYRPEDYPSPALAVQV